MTTASVPRLRSTEQAGWLDRVVDGRGSLRAVAVLRLLAGIIVIRYLWPDLTASALPVDRFHVPWWSWLPVPSHGEYRALLYLGVAAGACMVVGVASRVASVVSFVVVSYLLSVDMTGFAHNRAFLVWRLFGLSLLPARREGCLWPLTLLRVIVSSVYLTSGSTKLIETDWRSGLVLWDRVVRYQDHIPVGGSFHDLVTARATHVVLAPSAIAVELFIGVGLWFRRTRLVAVWTALVAVSASSDITAPPSEMTEHSMDTTAATQPVDGSAEASSPEAGSMARSRAPRLPECLLSRASDRGIGAIRRWRRPSSLLPSWLTPIVRRCVGLRTEPRADTSVAQDSAAVATNRPPRRSGRRRPRRTAFLQRAVARTALLVRVEPSSVRARPPAGGVVGKEFVRPMVAFLTKDWAAVRARDQR